MPDGFPGRPKILRGALFEYGLSLPPLFVVFQFNPLQITRNRSIAYSAPNSSTASSGGDAAQAARAAASQQNDLRDFHQTEFEGEDNLIAIRDRQQVKLQEESIAFDIRLDATDKLEDGDAITTAFGITPQLSTLELMVHPKEESLLGAALGSLLGSPGGFSFTKSPNPPIVLLIWGYKKVLPVNINSMNITEMEFSPILDPIRATVSLNLTVIEGPSIPYLYTKAVKEASSVLNLANIADVANVVIPG